MQTCTISTHKLFKKNCSHILFIAGKENILVHFINMDVPVWFVHTPFRKSVRRTQREAVYKFKCLPEVCFCTWFLHKLLLSPLSSGVSGDDDE